ncbi:hypothetical protein KIN34_04940 [Cellulomonas sp. DKR-3]|uniref:DUF559 domain-containing protein n=1 Tax=Cellulomonas fulva TaxID=2835530 RepID=A0ABS5TWW8_9CELL|nr:type IV toxin-antitoxin system AbiEi family antitoxin domain-containing protein [Cellulomonas fulva]MBT0993631.1 hypothetical protein [Cellulomonas fulva]
MRTVVLPDSLLALAAQQVGLVSGRQCDEHGVGRDSRTRLVASGRWRRVTSGVLDVRPPGAPTLSPDDRRLRAALAGLLALGPAAIAVGTSALVLHGVHGLPVHLQPEAAVPGGVHRRSRDGIRLRQYASVQPQVVAGHRSASLVDALVEALPELPRRHGLAVMDDVLHRGALASDAVPEIERRMRGRRGVARVRTWWGHIDGRAESPFESFARLECLDDGLVPDELQLEMVLGDGRGLVRGDMAWRLPGGRWLLVELDGDEFHSGPAAVLADRDRQNRIALSGRADLLRFAYPDLGTGRIPRTVCSALPPTTRSLRL